MMILKNELKKFGISSIFTFILIFYYNTNQFRDRLLDGLNTSTLGMFEETYFILAVVLFYGIGYLYFNIFYFSVHFIFKYFKVNKSVLKFTVSLVSVFVFIYMLNNFLIFNQLKDYEFLTGSYIPMNHENAVIDSLNYKDYIWERKEANKSATKEVLTFKTDSSLKISGSEIVLDKFYLIRKLLGMEKKYERNWKYIYGNNSIIFDSLNTAATIQIKNNRLYVNRYFYN
ncbi:MAG: hypothetical protein D8M58_22165 [Calditrichaeota bacterium]|nr:MAG: hypothetical protein DWQ03_08555 [Calditrichota bacterium]MBL1208119.1 hypothetical protein [Calditrichota bacterium]NOG47957.1 hypothetical protein [Calditrichota bacterium]